MCPCYGTARVKTGNPLRGGPSARARFSVDERQRVFGEIGYQNPHGFLRIFLHQLCVCDTKVTPGKWRRIDDLSHCFNKYLPWEFAPNSFSQKWMFPVRFASIRDAIENIHKWPGLIMATWDMTNAYHHLCINHKHWGCTGFQHKGNYYFRLVSISAARPHLADSICTVKRPLS